MKKLQVNQQLTFEGRHYRVNGFDEYTLTNIYGKIKKWTSYTIIDITDEDNRIWIGYGITEKFFVKMWLISEEEFKKQTSQVLLKTEFTGIANITFTGDQGYSHPISELICFESASSNVDLFAIERFLEKNGEYLKPLQSYYHALKIVKDFSV